MMADSVLKQADKWENVDDAVRSVTDSVALLYGFTVDMITAADTLAGVLAKIASGNFAGAGVAIGGMMDSAGKAGAEALKELYRRRAELEEAAGNKDAEAARLALLQEQTDEIGNQTGAIDNRTAAEKKAADAAARASEKAWKDAESTYKKVQAELARIEKMKEDAFKKDVANAMAAAKKHFEIEKQKEKAMRDAVSKGPGAGMELGSSEAAKFMADQVNAAIGTAAVPEKPTPGEAELLEEARKQFAEIQKQTALQKHQEERLAGILTAVENNGFRRVR
jgi:hypothetical protein